MQIPQPPPPLNPAMADGGVDPAILARLLGLSLAGVGPTPGGKYLHWDELRHRQPPAPLSAIDWWYAAKLARHSISRTFGLLDTKGRPFRFALVPALAGQLHRIDRDAAGSLRAPAAVTDPGTRDRYLISSLFEEAIASSQLEGASTTRETAKQMLREGRTPVNHGERMIVNNYNAMSWLRERQHDALTPAMVFELHRLVSEGTLDDPAHAGRFRRDVDEIVVADEVGRILHRPPRDAELPARLERLCAFANAPDDEEPFLHPVVRSILLHFWFAYDHPFVDGNGRVARALFYWSMARHGYWLCEYLSISRILKKARAQYVRAFLYAESDDNDATYFIVHQLRVLDLALNDLHASLDRKAEQSRHAEDVLRLSWTSALTLNERQLALLAHALRTHTASYTVESHRASHAVAYQTARTDLLSLAKDGLLEKRKRGNKFVFAPSHQLRQRVVERP